MKIHIFANSDASAVQIAKAELERCLFAACGAVSDPAGIPLALEISGDENGNDSYGIDVTWSVSCSRIVGNRPRAVLFGAYRLLRELGFRWIRPDADGEIVPQLQGKALPSVHLREQAGTRFRGVCIEGADSIENVRNMIQWMSRHGMNAYFIQFRDADTFFRRWYRHEKNPLLAPEPYDLAAINAELRREIKARDLELQMVGHGWTCEPFGIRGIGWYPYEEPIPAETAGFFAEVKGKRELWEKIPLNTNLCYGNPEVREKMLSAIVDFAGKNPDVDVIHFWLADGFNNHCECGRCTQMRPSDWYAQMLNDLDDRLTAAGLPVRIVFLIYFDLLWAPEKVQLHNSDRFILMFAPITRSYSAPFPTERDDSITLPEYTRNRLVMPKEPAANLRFLDGWKARFPGASFDFDYHLMWDYLKDPGYYANARVLQEDCRNLKKLGLDGLVSCQNQRALGKNTLAMTAMARTLWDPELPFDGIAEEFFRDAYGAEGASAAREYFRRSSEVFHPELIRGEGTREERLRVAATLPEELEHAVSAVLPALEMGKSSAVPAVRESWEQLALHVERNRLYARMLVELWTTGTAAAEPARDALIAWAREHELRLQSGFDVFELQIVLEDQLFRTVW